MVWTHVVMGIHKAYFRKQWKIGNPFQKVMLQKIKKPKLRSLEARERWGWQALRRDWIWLQHEWPWSVEPISDEMKWSTCNWTNMTEGVARRGEMMSRSGRRLEDQELTALGDQLNKEIQTERPSKWFWGSQPLWWVNESTTGKVRSQYWEITKGICSLPDWVWGDRTMKQCCSTGNWEGAIWGESSQDWK